jgi:hypothetical protein
MTTSPFIEENIRPGYAHNFTKYPQFDGSGNIYSRVYAPYDYESIMHYPEWAFRYRRRHHHRRARKRAASPIISLTGDAFSAASVYGQPTSGKLRRLFDAVVFASDAPGAYLQAVLPSGSLPVGVHDQRHQTTPTPSRLKSPISTWTPIAPTSTFGDNTGDGILDYSGEHLTFPSTGAYKITVNEDDLSYTIEANYRCTPLTVGFRNPTYFTGETPYIYFWDSSRR